jgi:hypothetical protein
LNRTSSLSTCQPFGSFGPDDTRTTGKPHSTSCQSKPCLQKQFGIAYLSGMVNGKISIAKYKEKRREEGRKRKGRTFVYFPKIGIHIPEGRHRWSFEINEETTTSCLNTRSFPDGLAFSVRVSWAVQRRCARVLSITSKLTTY